MIRRYAAELRAAFFLTDGLLAAAVFLAVSWWRFGSQWPSHWTGVVPWPLLVPAAYALAWVVALAVNGMYHPRLRWTAQAEAFDVIRTTAWIALGILAFLFLAHLFNVSRLFLLALFPTQAVVTITSRAVLRVSLRRLRSTGRNTRFVLIVGAGERGRALAERLERNPWLGLQVMGFLDDDEALGRNLPFRFTWLGGLDRFGAVLHELVVDEVAVCIPMGTWTDALAELVRTAEDEGKIVRVPIDLGERAFVHTQLEELDGMPVYSLVGGPDRTLALAAKRVVDVLGAVLGLVVLSPLFAASALAVLLADGRPILFRQERIGLHGRRFQLAKFRTMVRDAEERLPELLPYNERNGHAFKLTDDPRVTRAGRFLRRTSLDELPQLWNVLRGEMSLVGPRPPLPGEVAEYDGWHRRRLSMKPGMTGLWQIEARRNPDFDAWVERDLAYIDSWSLLLDLRILARTLPTVLLGTGR